MKTLYAKKLEHLYTLWDGCEYEKKLQRFTDSVNQKYAIYGAGKLGVRMAALLKSQYASSPLAFIDREAEKGTYYISDLCRQNTEEKQ